MKGGPRIPGPGKKIGRPKSKAKRVTISASVHPETVPKLNKLARAIGSRGRAIDQLVKNAAKEKV